jgi:hypothetical protein
MSLKPLYFSLLLAAINVQAGEFAPGGYEPARGSTEWNAAHGVTREPTGFGDRLEITIDEYGHASSRKRISGSDNSGDQLRVYDNSIPGLNSVDTIDYGDYEDYDD